MKEGSGQERPPQGCDIGAETGRVRRDQLFEAEGRAC